MSSPHTRTAVAYYRVSTEKQGRSGLGLEAQEAAVTTLATQRNLRIVQTFSEVETGTRKKRRPQLEAALDMARRLGGVLLIAKLDRLARNVAFVSALMDSGVDFIAADMPDADRLTLHVMAVVAEREAALISQRTRDALAARRARGLPVGGIDNLSAAARALGPAQNRIDAIAATRQPAAMARLLRQKGETLASIAAQLNAAGFRTRQGGLWVASQVKRVLDRTTA